MLKHKQDRILPESQSTITEIPSSQLTQCNLLIFFLNTIISYLFIIIHASASQIEEVQREVAIRRTQFSLNSRFFCFFSEPKLADHLYVQCPYEPSLCSLRPLLERLFH
jgi:hypothetical protein